MSLSSEDVRYADERIEEGRYVYALQPYPRELRLDDEWQARKEIAGEYGELEERDRLSREEQERLGELREALAIREPRMRAEVRLDREPRRAPRFSGASRELRDHLRRQGIRSPMSYVWVGGAENIPGEIVLPDSSFVKGVFVTTGDPRSPEVREVPHRREATGRPYYTREDGQIRLFVDSFSGGGTWGDYELSLLADYELGDSGNFVDWHPTANLVAVAESITTLKVKVLEYDNGSLTLLDDYTLGGGPLFVRWHPDGDKLAAGGYDNKVTVLEWDDGDEELSLLDDHNVGGFATIGDWHHTEDWIAVGVGHGNTGVQVLEYDAVGESISELATFAFATQWGRAVHWHPTADLFTASERSDFHVFEFDGTDSISQKATYDFSEEGASPIMLSARWHPDGEEIATSGRDGHVTVLRWNAVAETLTKLDDYDLGEDSDRVGWHPTEDLIVAADRSGHVTVLEWDDSGEELIFVTDYELEGAVYGVSWHHTEDWIATADADDTASVLEFAAVLVLVVEANPGLSFATALPPRWRHRVRVRTPAGIAQAAMPPPEWWHQAVARVTAPSSAQATGLPQAVRLVLTVKPPAGTAQAVLPPVSWYHTAIARVAFPGGAQAAGPPPEIRLLLTIEVERLDGAQAVGIPPSWYHTAIARVVSPGGSQAVAPPPEVHLILTVEPSAGSAQAVAPPPRIALRYIFPVEEVRAAFGYGVDPLVDTTWYIYFLDAPSIRTRGPLATKVIVYVTGTAIEETAEDVTVPADRRIERRIALDDGDSTVCQAVADRLLAAWNREQASVTGVIAINTLPGFTQRERVYVREAGIEDEELIVQKIEHSVIPEQTTTITLGDIILSDTELLARILDELE